MLLVADCCLAIEMIGSPAVTCNPSRSHLTCASGLSKFTLPENGLAFSQSHKKPLFSYCALIWRAKGQRNHLKFVVAAELASSSFSLKNSDLSSQTLQSQDVSQLRWIGPVPGDIAEIEAYCRIFRAAENLHTTVMDALCDPVTGECIVASDFSPLEKPLLEDKIATVLGCMVSLQNKGREDVLSGRSSILSSFRVADEVLSAEDKLPPLAVFRGEMKRCCESLHVALGSFLMPGYNRSSDVLRKLQRLKNLCYDFGFPRGDDCPEPWLIANWEPVYFFSSKDVLASKESEVAFWKGGQLTVESLEWLLERGFKTIVDLRKADVKDKFYQPVLDDAVKHGKVELYSLPIEIGTAPSVEQVEKFASLVSDGNKRPIYVHSREGALRTSAIISRWRQYMAHLECQVDSNVKLAGSLNRILLANESSYEMLKDKFVKDEDQSRQSHADGQDVACRESSSGHNSLQSHGGRNDLACKGSISGKASSLEEANGDEVQVDVNMGINPMRSQLPPSKALCRKDMSTFFKSRRTSPPSFFSPKSNVLIQPEPSNAYRYVQGRSEITDQKSTLIGASEVASSCGSSLSENMSVVNLGSSSCNTLANDVHLSEKKVVDGFSDKEELSMSKSFTGTGRSGDLTGLSASTKKDEKKNGPTSVLPLDVGLEELEGNMCASTTGVVRVQSRKKAEMFLVRTDGFSCTREKVSESSLAITHPSTQQQMLLWKSVPKTVLLLKKLGPVLMEEAKEVASFLHYKERMNILVEPEVHDMFERIPGFGFVQTFYIQDTSDLHKKVDFVACLGGDGVILHASNLFRGPVPPVVSFNLGSLGFLTSHIFEDYKQDLRHVIHGNNTRDGVYITLRMRLRCEIYRHSKMMPGKVFDVLNEVVVDRGSNPYLSKIDCYDHDRLITKVQGDGVIIATPTGSTAYSTSAGGSMVHPNVPCMLFTPICPHSLSFRPVILPDSARLELKIPEDARSNAWVSFDGKRRQQLSRGDSIKISMSEHPLPTVNKSDQTGDWFHSLIRCLNWNERLEQKAL